MKTLGPQDGVTVDVEPGNIKAQGAKRAFTLPVKPAGIFDRIEVVEKEGTTMTEFVLTDSASAALDVGVDTLDDVLDVPEREQAKA